MIAVTDRPSVSSSSLQCRPGDPRRAELIERARHLRPIDQVIVELSLGRDLSFRQIGLIVQLQPGAVWRRLECSRRRLQNPVSVVLTARSCKLPPDVRALGIAHFLRGESIAELATTFGISQAKARRTLQFLRGFCSGQLVAQEHFVERAID